MTVAHSGAVDWQAQGACQSADTKIFFSDIPSDALAICTACPVRDHCRSYALADPSLHGVWGGTTTEYRAAVRNGRLSKLVEVLWSLIDRPNEWARVGYGPQDKVSAEVESLRRNQAPITGVRFEVRISSAGDGSAELFARYVPGLSGLRVV